MEKIEAAQIHGQTDFWRILSTTERTQTAVMVLGPGQVSGEYGTDHPQSDQVLFCLSGSGVAAVEGQELAFRQGDLLIITAGEKHQIKGGPCSTLNIYGPPAYPEEGYPYRLICTISKASTTSPSLKSSNCRR